MKKKGFEFGSNQYVSVRADHEEPGSEDSAISATPLTDRSDKSHFLSAPRDTREAFSRYASDLENAKSEIERGHATEASLHKYKESMASSLEAVHRDVPGPYGQTLSRAAARIPELVTKEQAGQADEKDQALLARYSAIYDDVNQDDENQYLDTDTIVENVRFIQESEAEGCPDSDESLQDSPNLLGAEQYNKVLRCSVLGYQARRQPEKVEQYELARRELGAEEIGRMGL